MAVAIHSENFNNLTQKDRKNQMYFQKALIFKYNIWILQLLQFKDSRKYCARLTHNFFYKLWNCALCFITLPLPAAIFNLSSLNCTSFLLPISSYTGRLKFAPVPFGTQKLTENICKVISLPHYSILNSLLYRLQESVNSQLK